MAHRVSGSASGSGTVMAGGSAGFGFAANASSLFLVEFTRLGWLAPPIWRGFAFAWSKWRKNFDARNWRPHFGTILGYFSENLVHSFQATGTGLVG
jgi:hypothetical protein